MAPKTDADIKVDDKIEEALQAEAPESIEDVLAKIKPLFDPVVWMIDDSAFVADPTKQIVRAYEQQPMGAFQKMEFFGILTGAIEAAMRGPSGFSVNEIIAAIPDDMGKVVTGEKKAADAAKEFIGSTNIDSLASSLLALFAQLPGFIEDAILVIIGVPREERGWAYRVITQAPARGGWTDDQMAKCLGTFIDQNADAMRDFIVEHGVSLFKRWQTQAKRMVAQRDGTGASPSSKQSRPSQQDAATP